MYLKILGIWSNIFHLIRKHEGAYTKPENLGFCYRPKSMPNNIIRQYQGRIENSV